MSLGEVANGKRLGQTGELRASHAYSWLLTSLTLHPERRPTLVRLGEAAEGRGTAIVGDVLFVGSIGRTDFPRGDFDTLIASIRDRLLPLGDEVVFHCGHGPSGTLGNEARTNPFLVAPERYRGMM